jgi:Rho-binding antiterminator
MANKISCDAHDYFEIVCMRQSKIEVITKNNVTYTGIATDIIKLNGQEVLTIKAQEHLEQVPLIEVKTLIAIGNKITNHNFSVEW